MTGVCPAQLPFSCSPIFFSSKIASMKSWFLLKRATAKSLGVRRSISSKKQMFAAGRERTVSLRVCGCSYRLVAGPRVRLTHDHVCALVLVRMSPRHRTRAARRHKEGLPASAGATSAWTASQMTGMLPLLLLLMGSATLMLALHLARCRLMGRAVLVVWIALWLRHDV